MTTPIAGYELAEGPSSTVVEGPPPAPRPAWLDRAPLVGALLLFLFHGVMIGFELGGRPGIFGEWPVLKNDHGIHYQHGMMARRFLRSTGHNAGYDPTFMSGYPLSIVSDLSSTLSDLAIAASGGRPALGYKLEVFGCAAAFPCLIGLVTLAWGMRPTATFLAVLLSILYYWVDFPRNYVVLGMQNYLISVPLGLVAVASLAGYCDRGGWARWLGALAACSGVFLVHLTSSMLVAPAGLLAYGSAVALARREGRAFPISRHLGLWALAPLILALNSFWLLPGFLLSSTKGASDFAFSHSGDGVRGVFYRLGEIFWLEGPIQSILLGLAPVGLVVLGRRKPLAAAGLGGFLVAGFGWGYLAGLFPSLDVLQPGRHTLACYSAACVAGGIGLAEAFAKLRPGRSGRLDLWLALALLSASVRVFGPAMHEAIVGRAMNRAANLDSQPTARMDWLVSKIRRHVNPGERLYFEETGLAVPGLIDPYEVRHLSPVLPELTGVEVIGGPYLHATLNTNFTQFGENKLFEKVQWDRAFFLRHARLYRPSAICCWSPRARLFCQANPDLIEVVEDDHTVLLARVIGFGGSTIQGSAEVEAGPNRLVVRNAIADPLGDGRIILRYHAVPHLKADPPVEIEPVLLEDDPVPFIGLKPTPGPVTIEMTFPLRPSGPK